MKQWQNQQTVADSETREEPQPEVTSEQAARILARPRRRLRRAGATASASSSGHLPLAPPQSLTISTNPEQSSQSPSRVPELIAPQTTAEPSTDKGKVKMVFSDFDVPAFDVPAHERPLTKEEEMGLNSLSFAQTSHLIERHRAGIDAESRPRHKQEFYEEIKLHLQANFKAELATETARLQRENESLQNHLKTMKQSSCASFLKSQEKGEKDAINAHATRWMNMDQQNADKAAEKPRIKARTRAGH